MALAVAVLLSLAVLAALSGFAGLVLGAEVLAKALLTTFVLLFVAAVLMSFVSRAGADTAP